MRKKLFAILMINIFLLASSITPLISGINTKVREGSISKGLGNNIIFSADDETEYWALLVAVGVYADNPDQSLPKLLELVDDLYDVLIASGWSADHIKVLKGKDATVKNIVEGLRWLDKMDDGNDIALVYISTHGTSIPGPLDIDIPTDIPPKDEEDGCDEVLVGYWGFAYPLLGVIWDDRLNFLLNRLDSKGVCLVVWSCQSGGFNEPIFWNKSGKVVLTACREDEKPEDANFPFFLIDGLRGFADVNMDGVVSAEEVFNYAKKRVDGYHPTMHDDYPGELPLTEVNIDLSNIGENNGGHDVDDEETLLNDGSIGEYNRMHDVDDEEALLKGRSIGEYNRMHDVDDEEALLKGRSMVFLLSETSIVQGYITDAVTDELIENANVTLYWQDDLGYYHFNFTHSDDLGFYSMNVTEAAEEIWLNVNADGYLSEYTERYDVGENETLWLNVSMDPKPSENSTVCGYVTDSLTDDPIEGADVHLDWWDDFGHHDWNHTYSDVFGFYSLNVAEGEIYLDVYAGGYFSERTEDYGVGEDEILWVNVSMYPRPSENSVVCGYVTDVLTGDPVEGADVSLRWQDDQGHSDWNDTYSDVFGFYSFNVAEGEIKLYVYADGYYREYTDRYGVGEDEILWVNVSMYPRPFENSVVCGYVTDVLTGDPVEGADVSLYWRDDFGHHDWNDTYSDAFGFYSMHVAAGEIYLYVYAGGYYSERTEDYDVGEDEILWVNVSMYPHPSENSIVCGYIIDSLTDDPIEGADVSLYWWDDFGHSDWNDTYSDVFGFYSLNVAEGEIYLDVHAGGYYSEYTDRYGVGEDEILWVNVSMYPRPSENSVVCGYVTDVLTGDPVEGADVNLRWQDDQGHSDWNDTYSDVFGFYSMHVAAGEIYLDVYAGGYFSERTEDYDVGEDEILWVNVSMYPRPSENSVVCGYVTDVLTGDPVEGADVNLRWQDDQGHSDWNDTYSNSSGFYSMHVAAGEIYLDVYKDWYLDEYTDWYCIDEDEILWVNVSMYPRPSENSIVCGHIKDSLTKEPIISASVDLEWLDGEGHDYWNFTYSNSSGFYSMHVAAGEVYLWVEAGGYHNERTYRNDAKENKTLWVNVSLDLEIIEVDITKPLKAFYRNNNRLMPFFRPLIIGDIDLEVFVHDYRFRAAEADKVEFYIDGELKATDNNAPYSWTWDERALGRHNIKVVAYDKDNNTATDSINVTVFNLGLKREKPGIVKGRVTGDDLCFTKYLRGAKITAEQVDASKIYRTRTGIILFKKGRYGISLPPGVYNITASKIGYESQTIHNVSVNSTERVTLDFNLERKTRLME